MQRYYIIFIKKKKFFLKNKTPYWRLAIITRLSRGDSLGGAIALAPAQEAAVAGAPKFSQTAPVAKPTDAVVEQKRHVVRFAGPTFGGKDEINSFF